MIVLERTLASRTRARIRFTDRSSGDLHPESEGVAERRAAVDPRPWTWVHQVHGSEVVEVARPGEGAGRTGDAIVTRCRGAVLAVQGADCAPVVFYSPEGVVGVAHAGWRGIEAGVLSSTVSAMRGLGAVEIAAVVGPHIGPERYEFGEADLRRLHGVLGFDVATLDREGRPALDVSRAIAGVLHGLGVRLDHDVDRCTATSERYWSHRASGDRCRQVGLVVLEGRAAG
ncbi:MAG TPA: laccase domain-containing protein [Acidimicrobiales bacterium]|nr:laccase domain-containing protein [Acidimicrobiales bacterium]